MCGCSLWNDDAYEFALENQAGQGLCFENPQDRKALVMGLALHEQGKQSLNKVLAFVHVLFDRTTCLFVASCFSCHDQPLYSCTLHDCIPDLLYAHYARQHNGRQSNAERLVQQ